MMAHLRAHLPLWIESAKGNPQWDAIFAGYHSSTDYPGCMFWRELAAHYPEAKIILTTRDADKWFEFGHRDGVLQTSPRAVRGQSADGRVLPPDGV